jgi:hypothetical protein
MGPFPKFLICFPDFLASLISRLLFAKSVYSARYGHGDFLSAVFLMPPGTVPPKLPGLLLAPITAINCASNKVFKSINFSYANRPIMALNLSVFLSEKDYILTRIKNRGLAKSVSRPLAQLLLPKDSSPAATYNAPPEWLHNKDPKYEYQTNAVFDRRPYWSWEKYDF